MKALVLNALHEPLQYQDIPLPHPEKGETVVTLRAAALNHRDVWITKGQYAGIRYPSILGSDGAGDVRGKAVLINPAFQWGDNPAAQGKDFNILGLPTDGTFAEAVKVPRNHLHPMPAHLDYAQAAALPLAGLTAWRTLFSRCQLKKGEKVLISGVGGGVALFALQFAIAAGAAVWVTSGSADKIAKAVGIGAQGGANYREEGWDKQLKQQAGGFDVVIDAAAGDGFAALVSLCNPGARIGLYGGTHGKMGGISPQLIFWKQISILGSTMGTNAEFKQMLAFVVRHEIVPVIDRIYALADGNAALARMEAGEQFGKIILTIG